MTVSLTIECRFRRWSLCHTVWTMGAFQRILQRYVSDRQAGEGELSRFDDRKHADLKLPPSYPIDSNTTGPAFEYHNPTTIFNM